MEDVRSDAYDNYDDTSEDSEYSSKSDFSKGKMSYDAFIDVIKARGVEMKTGYFNTTVSADGFPQKSWISDTRKRYWSTVQALRRILAPEILSSENKEKIIKVIEEMDNLFNDYCYKEKVIKVIDGKSQIAESKRKYMPNIDDPVKVIKEFPDGNKVILEKRGGWNIYINAYWDNIVILSDRLLEELIKIVHDGNYFKTKTRFG